MEETEIFSYDPLPISRIYRFLVLENQGYIVYNPIQANYPV